MHLLVCSILSDHALPSGSTEPSYHSTFRMLQSGTSANIIQADIQTTSGAVVDGECFWPHSLTSPDTASAGFLPSVCSSPKLMFLTPSCHSAIDYVLAPADVLATLKAAKSPAAAPSTSISQQSTSGAERAALPVLALLACAAALLA